MGGVWKRLIRSVRKVLTSVANQQTLTDEILYIFVCLTENIVNSRPLSTLSNDPRDVNLLTPNHLLQPCVMQIMPFGTFDSNDMYVRRRWKQCQYLANLFLSRWRKEYLSLLHTRSKWLSCKCNATVCSVLLVDENLSRNSWMLGRVRKIFAGADGLVRSVSLLTRNNGLVRPVHKLCLAKSIDISASCQDTNKISYE